MTQTQKLINKSWDYWKEKFHQNTKNKGKELHHCNGRVGVYKCCPMLMIGLTPKEHHDWVVRKKIREDLRETILAVGKNFSKILGCKEAIAEVYCLLCPALSDEAKKRGKK